MCVCVCVCHTQVSEDAFAPGGPLAELALELQLWASYRGQLLARTVRGMMCYDKALRILARLENPCPPNMPRHTYDEWISQVVASKFSYVVSAQVRTLRHCIHMCMVHG